MINFWKLENYVYKLVSNLCFLKFLKIPSFKYVLPCVKFDFHK